LEREQLRKQAEASVQDAVGSARAYQNVLATLAHDLRSLLSVVNFSGEELLTSAKLSGDPKQVAPARSILQACSRMDLLLKHLLDDAKIRGGGISLRCSYFSAKDMLQDAAQLRPLALQRNIKLQLDEPAPGLGMRCDRARVGQVLANLISNAI